MINEKKYDLNQRIEDFSANIATTCKIKNFLKQIKKFLNTSCTCVLALSINLCKLDICFLKKIKIWKVWRRKKLRGFIFLAFNCELTVNNIYIKH